MKLTYQINGRRYTEKALKATLGEARVEDIKRHILYLCQTDAPTSMDWPLQGGTLRISVRP